MPGTALVVDLSAAQLRQGQLNSIWRRQQGSEDILEDEAAGGGGI